MKCKVLKFGGASIRDSAHIRNVARILNDYQNQKIVIVISAMGKTTNALEEVVKAYFEDREKALKLYHSIRNKHFAIAKELFQNTNKIFDELNDFFIEIEWILEDEPHDQYDYVYDQIVSIGELASTKIVQAFLKSEYGNSKWRDARSLIITDELYREAKVDWEASAKSILETIPIDCTEVDWIVTQGFIGSSPDNQTTTLGREGSDFSASIFSYILDAEEMIIWKDVPGILTADPSKFENVTKINRISYREAIEMTYYGAKVIHPKTIKPLENKSIPLQVKSFLDQTEEGTLISDQDALSYPPVIVIEPNQSMLHISTKDFSFVAEQHLSHLFDLFTKHRIKVNMMRNTAISFTICTHQNISRLKELIDELKGEYNIIIDKDLELITIRHFNDATVNEMVLEKIVLLEERLRGTIQLVVKDIPVIKRKG